MLQCDNRVILAPVTLLLSPFFPSLWEALSTSARPTRRPVTFSLLFLFFPSVFLMGKKLCASSFEERENRVPRGPWPPPTYFFFLSLPLFLLPPRAARPSLEKKNHNREHSCFSSPLFLSLLFFPSPFFPLLLFPFNRVPSGSTKSKLFFFFFESAPFESSTLFLLFPPFSPAFHKELKETDDY